MNSPLPPPEELQKLALYELLELLEDIQQPEPISYFPATPIWTWIFCLLILTLLVLLLLFWRYRQKERYRKLACRALDGLGHLKGPDYAGQISQLLKWTALTAFPRTQVANLVGNDWLSFLEKTCKKTVFTQGVGTVLGSAQYQHAADFDENALGALARSWIRHHQRGGRS